jgi:hypothetical protein
MYKKEDFNKSSPILASRKKQADINPRRTPLFVIGTKE